MVPVSTAATVLLLIGVTVLCARLAALVEVPAAVAIVIVGIAANGTLPHSLVIELRPPVLGLFLPALIFEGAWDVDAAALRKTAAAIAVLAIPGTLLAAGAIAAAAVVAGGFDWAAALALGAILAATDPVAVLALFRQLPIPVELFTTVEGESIANDGVAAALVQTVVPLAGVVAVASGDAVAAIGRFALLSAGGVAVGVAFALAGGPLVRRLRATWPRIAITLAVAYGSYGVATVAGCSGIFACAAAGVALPAVALAKRDAGAVERFWDGAAWAANGAVFLLVGLSLRLDRMLHEPLLFGATLGAAFAARAIAVYALTPLPVDPARAGPWRHALLASGIRGGLSIALALGLPQDFPHRPEIVDATFAVVFFTVVVQGWLLAPIVRRLRIS